MSQNVRSSLLALALKDAEILIGAHGMVVITEMALAELCRISLFPEALAKPFDGTSRRRGTPDGCHHVARSEYSTVGSN